MLEMSPEDIGMLCLDFTTTVNMFGETSTIELKPGGKDIEVTGDNVVEYVQLQVERMTFEQCREQLAQLLRGLYEVIPQHLLVMFDHQELELLLCGLPEINVDDWEAHTEYKGAYSEDNQIIRWFWQIVREWSQVRDFHSCSISSLLRFASLVQAVSLTLLPLCVNRKSVRSCCSLRQERAACRHRALVRCR